MKSWIQCLAVVLLLLVSPAEAALQSATQAVPLEKTWNPQAAGDDIVLPMPCDLKMVLRPVAVPSAGFTEDKRFFMGVGTIENERQQVYERRFESHIAAPFQQGDLPQTWTTKLPADEKTNYVYYFIGKYEVSEQQWAAVMEASCPAAPSATASQPVRNVSWFDMQLFFQKYNQWLIEHAAESLPKFAASGNIGFFRLPTEEEWEYAARGGSKVREEDRNNEDIFPLEGGKLADFGFFSDGSQPKADPIAIGSRKPNPLGLYDTVGNVKELVQGFFRFSVPDQRTDGELYRRLHGAAGGILCKGGSFRSGERDVLPGCRDEIPLYTAKGEQRLADLGFRVVLSGLNVPDAQRLDTVLKENANRAGRTPKAPVPPVAPAAEPPASDPQTQPADLAVKLNPEGNPLVELDKVVGAASSDAMRGNLTQLRALIEDMNSAQERQRDETLSNSIRSNLYQMESLRSFGYRYWVLYDKVTREKKTLSKSDAAALNGAMSEFFKLLLTATNFYKSGVDSLAKVPAETLKRHFTQIQKEFAGEDLLSKHMRQNLETLSKHIAQARTKGVGSLDKKQICLDILPAVHAKVLPF